MILRRKHRYYRHHSLIPDDLLREQGNAQAILRPFFGLKISEAAQCTTPLSTAQILGLKWDEATIDEAANSWAWRCKGLDDMAAFYAQMADNIDEDSKRVADRMQGVALDTWSGMVVRACRYFGITPQMAENTRLADVMLMDKAAYLDYVANQLKSKKRK